jgi:hypothetical protein
MKKLEEMGFKILARLFLVVTLGHSPYSILRWRAERSGSNSNGGGIPDKERPDPVRINN